MITQIWKLCVHYYVQLLEKRDSPIWKLFADHFFWLPN